MLSFASKLVRSIEHSAETIINGDDHSATSLADDAYFTHANGSTHGFRVVNVEKDTLAHEHGIQSWFDYIIGINGHEIPTNYTEHNILVPNHNHFINEIANSRDGKVEFHIWSAKGGVVKIITLPVERNGANLEEIPIGQSQPSTTLEQHLFKRLGFSLQWTPLITSTFVYHVLQIHPNSPAQRAGLIEHSDFIIGAQDGLLATGGEDLLSRVIASKKNQKLEIYVYNQDYDVVRPVLITPVDNWGGVGLLGAGVGYGFLHRIPFPSYHEPGAVLFDGGVSEAEPVQYQLPGSTVPPPTFQPAIAPPVHGRKKKPAHAANPDLLDYLQQEGEKSRQLDSQSGIKHDESSSIPPPPRK